MENGNIMSRKDFENQIIKKAWRDPEYKERLINNPKLVIEEELKAIDPNFKFSQDIDINVITEENNKIYIVIPEDPEKKEKERQITEDEINDIDGGSIIVLVFYAVAVAVQIAAAANAAVAGNVAGTVNIAANVNAAVNVNANSTINV